MAWSDAELERLRRAYALADDGPVNLRALAQLLGRSHTKVCEKARELGLTRYGRDRGPEHAAAFTARWKERLATKGHPRGMLGVRHTAEARAKMSAGQRIAGGGKYERTQEWRRNRSVATSKQLASGGNIYSRCRHGKRADIGNQYFRSSWEANYARFLNLLIAKGQITKWEYEVDTFWFEAIRRGVRSYTPDFKVTEPSGHMYYVEVKGWMDAKSKTKLKRMKKYHPSVDLRLVDAKAYREISRKLGGAIAGWEAA